MKLDHWQAPFPHYDKVLHFIEYSFFAWLWYRAIASWKGSSIWLWPSVILIIGLFGALDEAYQSTKPFRDASLYDILADTSGAIFMMSILFVKDRYYKIK